MFVSDEVIECMKGLIGWRNHYDLTDIPALNVSLNSSETGEFYQDYHPALRLDLIKQSLPANRDLDSYLEEKIKTGITQLLNDVSQKRKYDEYAKRVLANDILLNKYGWVNDKITNQGRFVGFRIQVTDEVGLKMIIKKIGTQFIGQTDPVDIYVYHTSKTDELFKKTVTPTGTGAWDWTEINTDLKSESKEYSRGYFYVGYYQDDLVGQAINYKDFDWNKGPCTSCDGGSRISKWRNLMKYMNIQPIYVPNASIDPLKKMFNVEDSFEVNDMNWGLNFNMSAECDLSTFFCEHRNSLKIGLGLKVTYLILKDMEFSQQINYIEESLKHLIIRDLEGDKDTNYVNIADRLNEEITNIVFDHSKISVMCLPCKKKKVNYGVM